jgi:hypothetical protein
MEQASWITGKQIPPANDFGRAPDEMEFWKNVLSNSDLRSRFIRDLEVQSISSRSAEDLAQRYREEEILGRSALRGA